MAQPNHVALDFSEAHSRLLSVSDALRGSELGVEDKRQLDGAASRLRLPDIAVDLKIVDSEKTLEVPLGPLKSIGAQYGVDSPLMLRERSWRSRPIIQASIPLYTGGAIPAQQRLAAAAVRQAEAEYTSELDAVLTQLVQAYFGQALAECVVTARQESFEGLQQHLADSERFEKHGQITHAQVLQARVARDQAEREYQQSLNMRDTSRESLALLLRASSVETVTPLFVLKDPLGERSRFQKLAVEAHPQMARAQAIMAQAQEMVRIQQATRKPELFAFGQYDAHKSDSTLVEPDWAVGIGVRYTFLSAGRKQQIAAAHARSEQASAMERELRKEIEIAVTRAFNAMSNAQIQFSLLASAIDQAEESLRLQTLSFREGQATSLDVIDARISLMNARVARAQAAYQFDVSLAGLLEASGMAQQFAHYAGLPSRVDVQ